MYKKTLRYLITIATILQISCSKIDNNDLSIGVSAQYPPFVYMKNNKLSGFDISLIEEISKQMNRNITFKNMDFSSFFPSLNSNQINIAISCITITEERKKNFDFSTPYYFETIAALFYKNQNIKNIKDLENLKIGMQLGTTIEIWASKKFPKSAFTLMDTTTQLLEALKNNYIDVILISKSHSIDFSKNNKELSWIQIDDQPQGCGIMFKKNSTLTNQVNNILNNLENNGKITQLYDKWFS